LIDISLVAPAPAGVNIKNAQKLPEITLKSASALMMMKSH